MSNILRLEELVWKNTNPEQTNKSTHKPNSSQRDYTDEKTFIGTSDTLCPQTYQNITVIVIVILVNTNLDKEIINKPQKQRKRPQQ